MAAGVRAVMARGIRLAAALVAVSVLLFPASQAHSAAAFEDGGVPISVSAGFSGYAVPLPDYAARIVADSDSRYSTASLVYSDISLAPLHIRLDESHADSTLEVIVYNRASAVSLSPPIGFLVEPSVELPEYLSESGNGEGAARVVCRLQVTMPVKGESDYYLPIQLYQGSRNLDSTALQVEVLFDGESLSKETVELIFLPRGRTYSCLVEAEGRGLLEVDSLALTDDSSTDPRLSSPGFLQEHAVLSVAAGDLGPDFRVLRHFAFIVVSANTWFELSRRQRTLLTQAASMGSRLVVYGAANELDVGNVTHAPKPGLSLNSYGFGEVAVSAEDLAALRTRLAELLRGDLHYAYKLALGGSADEVSDSSQRDLIVRGTLGSLNRGYSWLGYLAALPRSEASVNPIWAYNYVTRAGLLHPLDVTQLRWDSRLREDAGTELIERSRAGYPPLHWHLSKKLSRSSHPYGSAIALYTLLALVLTVFLSVYRRSHFWLIPAFLALSALATALIVYRTGAGQAEALALSASLTSPRAGADEVRNVIYLTSARAAKLDVGFSSEGFALGHVAPLNASEVNVTAGAGNDVTLKNLRIAPLIPLEVSYSEVPVVTHPVSYAWRTLAEGNCKLTLTANEPISFAFLVDRTRALYLGRMEEGRSYSVVLPHAEAKASNEQVRSDAIVAGLAYQAYSADQREHARDAAGGELLDLASRYLSSVLLHEVVRTLIAEGRGATLLGLRFGEFRLLIDDEVVHAPHAEIAVYRLER